jgi:hypothetical protein
MKDHRLRGDGLALYIQTAGKYLSVLATVRPEMNSGATPHRSINSLQCSTHDVNYSFVKLTISSRFW